MARKLNPVPALDLSELSTCSLSDRQSKMTTEGFGNIYEKGSSLKSFIAGLPDFLQARELRELASRIANAHKNDKVIALGMGAHNVKVGLQPLYAGLMDRGLVTSISTNGAAVIHDFELAFVGQSSEEVGPELDGGRFGMAEETGKWLNRVIREGYAKGKGIGEAVGEAIWEENLPYRDKSLFAAAYRNEVVATVHVAMGTDIIHMHPDVDGEAIGGASLIDFNRFAAVVGELEGGAYLNIGSAVVMPEVFLKALTLARNLGKTVDHITTADLDFIRHYRPGVNVVERPTRRGGRGFRLTGPHEIMVPLLFASVLEEL